MGVGMIVRSRAGFLLIAAAAAAVLEKGGDGITQAAWCLLVCSSAADLCTLCYWACARRRYVPGSPVGEVE